MCIRKIIWMFFSCRRNKHIPYTENKQNIMTSNQQALKEEINVLQGKKDVPHIDCLQNIITSGTKER